MHIVVAMSQGHVVAIEPLRLPVHVHVHSFVRVLSLSVFWLMRDAGHFRSFGYAACIAAERLIYATTAHHSQVMPDVQQLNRRPRFKTKAVIRSERRQSDVARGAGPAARPESYGPKDALLWVSTSRGRTVPHLCQSESLERLCCPSNSIPSL
jgi:hypothetical protein